MKSYALFTTAVLVLQVASCSKETDPPPLQAASLAAGRAAIRFNTDRNFNGETYFEVINSVDTKTTFDTLSPSVRNIGLQTTELKEGVPTRKVFISIAVRIPVSGSTAIDLSRTSGLPMARIRLESFSLLGIVRQSVSGTLTITRLTDTMVEGSFTAATDDNLNITNGSFAGRL